MARELRATRESGVTEPAALLEEVSALSRRFGRDPEFARGGGGNSSGKADGILWIKPSGASLGALDPGSLMPLALEPLAAAVAAAEPADAAAGSRTVLEIALAARLRPTDPRRPSVECLFHAILPERIVVHTHPTSVNAVTCAERGREIAVELFGNAAIWIPYVDPGLPLARRIAAERRAHEARTGRPPPATLLLQSHGLVVGGASAGEIEERTARVVDTVRRALGPAAVADIGPPADRPGEPAAGQAADVAALVAGLLAVDGEPAVVVFDDSAPAIDLASTPAGRAFLGIGPLTPDQIVYAGSAPLLLERLPGDPADVARLVTARVREHAQATGRPPAIVVVPDLGLFAVGETHELAATARDVFLDAARVAAGAARLGGVRTLAPRERRFIEEWEAEAYRRSVIGAAGPAVDGGLSSPSGAVP